MRFVLLSTQRSGTSWVIERLAQDPSLVAYGELFLQRKGFPEWPLGGTDVPFYSTFREQRASKLRPLDTIAYLERLFAPASEPGHVVGFKLMYSEVLRFPEIWVYLCCRRVRIVHLVRENVLDTALSRLAMSQRSRIHVHGDQEIESVRLRVNVRELLRDLQELDRNVRNMRRLVRLSPVPSLTVSYENLTSDDIEFGRVLAFLGLDAEPSDLCSDMRRLTGGRSHEEVIENIDEVREALRATPYRHHFRV